MKKWIIAIFVCLAWAAFAQVPVAPIINPRVFFVDASGGPCAGCKLYSYIAGSTTPQPTYIDSTGIPTNTNPITLDPSGGAQVWFGRLFYKLVLKTPLGVTLWTVDNINAANGLPCGPARSIQIANSTVTGFNCDPNIFIDPVAHTLNVGILPTNHVTIGPLGTATSWTFDTTTPATACSSIGCSAVGAGTINQLAYYPASGTAIAGTSAIPNGITATTQAASDNSTKVATTAYVKTPGVIQPASVAINGGVAMTDNQGNGAKTQHSTGSATTDHLVKFDANGNTVDAGIPAPTSSVGILARWSGSSCTIGDDGTGGSGSQCTQGWGSTIAGTYYIMCQPTYDAAASCSNLGNCSALLVDIVSQTSTDFTYTVNTRTNTSRTHTIPITCWATN